MFLPLVFAAALCATVQGIEFINPPARGPNTVYFDNPSFAYGQNIDIQWTATNESISTVLIQPTQGAELEYLFQNRNDVSSFSWNFTTAKSLAVSRIFFFGIYITGDQTLATTSHYFNVTGDAGSASPSTIPLNPSTATLLSSTSSTPQATSASTSIGTSGNNSQTAASSAIETSGNGLSSGAKIGLGVGVSLGVIGLTLLAWFVYLYHKRYAAGWSNKPAPCAETSVYAIREQKPLHPYCDAVIDSHSELQGSPKHELPGRLAAELPDQYYR